MRRALAGLLLAASAGCVTPKQRVAKLAYDLPPAPLPASAGAPFRQHPPPASGPIAVPALKLERFTLANGLRVVVVERHRFPEVAARLLITLPAEGATSQEAARRNALLGDVCLSLSASVTHTAAQCTAQGCAIEARALTSGLDATLEDISTRVRGDGLTLRAVTRRRAEAIATIEASGRTTLHALDALFEGSPRRDALTTRWANPPTLEALNARRGRTLVPRAATLVLVGDLTLDEARTEAMARFGRWIDRPVEVAPAPAPAHPPPDAPRAAIHREAGAAQVIGYIAAPGPRRRDPDDAALRVLVERIGGAEHSAAFEHVREGLDAAYSVGGLVLSRPIGPLVVFVGAFDRRKAIDGMAALLALIRRARRTPMTGAELDRAKRALVAQWRARTDTNAGIAELLGERVLEGDPIDDALTFPARVDAVTPATVQAAARRYLAKGELRLMMFGAPSAVDRADELGFGEPLTIDVAADLAR